MCQLQVSSLQVLGHNCNNESKDLEHVCMIESLTRNDQRVIALVMTILFWGDDHD